MQLRSFDRTAFPMTGPQPPSPPLAAVIGKSPVSFQAGLLLVSNSRSKPQLLHIHNRPHHGIECPLLLLLAFEVWPAAEAACCRPLALGPDMLSTQRSGARQGGDPN
jgi:hypothetical protein